MAEAFLRLDANDRLDALGVAADRLGRPAHLLEKDACVNAGVKLGHGAAQNWATLGLRETFSAGGGQSAALSM